MIKKFIRVFFPERFLSVNFKFCGPPENNVGRTSSTFELYGLAGEGAADWDLDLEGFTGMKRLDGLRLI